MVEELLTGKALVIDFTMGMKAGKPDVKSRRFNNVKEDATPANIYATAEAMAELVDHQGARFKSVDTNELMKN